MNSATGKTSQFQWKRCFIFSALLHTTLTVLWIGPRLDRVFTIPVISAPRPTVNIRIRAQSKKSLFGEISAQATAFQSLTLEQQRKAFKEAAKQASNIPQQSILEIGKHLGADPNTFNPAFAPKNARFNMDSVGLYAIKKHNFPAEGMGYKITLVDNQGVTMVIDAPPEEAAVYDQMYFIFSLAEKNAAVKTIIHKIFNPLLPKLLGGRSLAPRHLIKKRRTAPNNPVK